MSFLCWGDCHMTSFFAENLQVGTFWAEVVPHSSHFQCGATVEGDKGIPHGQPCERNTRYTQAPQPLTAWLQRLITFSIEIWGPWPTLKGFLNFTPCPMPTRLPAKTHVQLQIILKSFNDVDITTSWFLALLLNKSAYNDHPCAKDLLKNFSTIFKTFIQHPKSSNKAWAWAFM